MADTDLPNDGAACDVVLTYDGVPVDAATKVEVRVTQIINTRRSKPLGSSTVLIATDPEGWRIELTLDLSRPGVQGFVDALTSGEMLKVPSLIGITIRRSFRNLDKSGHTYLDLKRTSYDEVSKRSDNDRVKLILETGLNRIAV